MATRGAETDVNKRGTIWQDDEVNALIALWGEEDTQAKLDGATRNIKVYEAIATKLRDQGFEGRTAVQCREKIKKLKGDYRKIKTHHNKTGRGRQTRKYMDQLDLILGHRPASEPPVVLQSAQQDLSTESADSDSEPLTGGELLDFSTGIVFMIQININIDGILLIITITVEGVSTVDTSLQFSTGDTSMESSTRDTSMESSTKDTSLESSDKETLETTTSPAGGTQGSSTHHGVLQDDSHGPSSSKDASAAGKTPSKKVSQRKQKRRQMDMEKIVGNFQKEQKESWDRFMEWEEKRMKLEAEQESKRQQQQQQHEMQLFSMLASALSNPPRWQPQEEFQQYPHYYDPQ